MKILVLVKEVPDTWDERKIDLVSGWVDRGASDPVLDEIGERSLEVALSYKDAHKDTEVVVVSMGPVSVVKSLRKGLAMGATSAIHVLDESLAGSDLLRTAHVLAATIRREGFDLVITGNESTDGRGGVLAAMLAEHLNIAQLTFLNSLEIRDDALRGERATESGLAIVSAPLPAVVSITERLPDARFPNLKGMMSAKKKPLSTWSLADLDLEGIPKPSSVVVSVSQRAARVGGLVVTDTGNAGNELADFLAARRLI